MQAPTSATPHTLGPQCTVEACWAWTQVNALPLPDVRARQTSQRFVRLYASPPCDRPNKSSKSLLPNAVPARAPCACAIGDMAQHHRAAPSQARRRDDRLLMWTPQQEARAKAAADPRLRISERCSPLGQHRSAQLDGVRHQLWGGRATRSRRRNIATRAR